MGQAYTLIPSEFHNGRNLVWDCISAARFVLAAGAVHH
jgi:hypothetical protein